MEVDKSLLTLSAGGIGLLVTLLSTVGVDSLQTLILSAFAMSAFGICLLTVLFILKRNAHHLEKVISENATESALLEFLDKLAIGSFIVALLFSSCLGICIAAKSLMIKQEQEMAKNIDSKDVVALHSLSGLKVFSVQTDINKSLAGIGKLASPSPSPAAQSSTPAPTPSAEKKE